jgi:hypothetical protein
MSEGGQWVAVLIVLGLLLLLLLVLGFGYVSVQLRESVCIRDFGSK